jgi:hypothetical protein
MNPAIIEMSFCELHRQGCSKYFTIRCGKFCNLRRGDSARCCSWSRLRVGGIEKMKLKRSQVALIGIGTFGWKDVIVFSPNNQGMGLIFAEIFLPLRI